MDRFFFCHFTHLCVSPNPPTQHTFDSSMGDARPGVLGLPLHPWSVDGAGQPNRSRGEFPPQRGWWWVLKTGLSLNTCAVYVTFHEWQATHFHVTSLICVSLPTLPNTPLIHPWGMRDLVCWACPSIHGQWMGQANQIVPGENFPFRRATLERFP